MTRNQNTIKTKYHKNTPWLGWKPGEPGKAFEEAFNCRRTVASWLPAEERTPEKQAEILADLEAACKAVLK